MCYGRYFNDELHRKELIVSESRFFIPLERTDIIAES